MDCVLMDNAIAKQSMMGLIVQNENVKMIVISMGSVIN